MSKFSAKQKDSISSGSFPLDANVLCTLIDYKWGPVSTKKGMLDAFILTFKSQSGETLIENIYDVTYENVYVFSDESRDAAFSRKSKEVNFIINNLLYAYGLQDVAENLQAETCRQFCEECIDALRPIHPENILIYLKTINNKEGYTEIPKRGNTPFIMVAKHDENAELLPGTLAYTSYEEKLIAKNKLGKNTTSEEKLKPGQIQGAAIMDDDNDDYSTPIKSSVVPNHDDNDEYSTPIKSPVAPNSDDIIKGFEQD